MSNDPREITARFDSTCPETGKPIKRGEFCVYYPRERKTFHPDSKTAEAFRSEAFDRNFLGVE